MKFGIWVNLGCFFVFSQIYSYSRIETIHGLGKISETVDAIISSGCSRQNLEKVLFIFEMNETLLVDEDYFVQHRFASRFVDLLKNLSIAFGVVYDQEDLLSKIIKQAKIKVVEDRFVDLLKMIKRDSMKVLFVSDYTIGRYGVIDDFAEFKIKQLRDVGLDFSTWAADNDRLNNVFDGLFGFPFFNQGFLFRNHACVSDTLTRFFSELKPHPELIVFVSNLPDNVDAVRKSVELFFNKMNYEVAFLGFEYVPTKIVNGICDMSIIKYQISKFLRTGMWISETLVKCYSFTRSDTTSSVCGNCIKRAF